MGNRNALHPQPTNIHATVARSQEQWKWILPTTRNVEETKNGSASPTLPKEPFWKAFLYFKSPKLLASERVDLEWRLTINKPILPKARRLPLPYLSPPPRLNPEFAGPPRVRPFFPSKNLLQKRINFFIKKWSQKSSKIDPKIAPNPSKNASKNLSPTTTLKINNFITFLSLWTSIQTMENHQKPTVFIVFL